MSILEVLLTLVLLAAVIAVVSRPLLAARKPVESETAGHADLTAAREAKYREIRDTELDYRTGKLSRDDFEAVNATLRTEAVEILDNLDALEAHERGGGQPASGEETQERDGGRPGSGEGPSAGESGDEPGAATPGA